jgi:pimeloyl-ACP methyl ester carboxylesterase
MRRTLVAFLTTKTLATTLTAILAAALTACGAPAPSTPESGSRTPVPTTQAPATQAPTTQAPTGERVTFPAADGPPVTGRLFGTGTRAAVLSNMGDNSPAHWERFAPSLVAKGYLVLTYAYRYPSPSRSISAQGARDAVNDLRGAVAFVRARGAQQVVLIGASLGGMVSAKAAGALGVNGVAVIASPGDRPDFEMRIEPAELAAIKAPKLFVASDGDPTVPAAETRRLFDASPEPKRWQVFTSTAHGTQLLDTPLAADFTKAIVDFAAT